jgi:[ribosomal protein S5]-alanine N-acetyltransferase
MNKYIIKTQRLGLRKWTDKDLLPFVEMNQDAKVMEFFPTTLTDEESYHLVNKIDVHFNTYGYGLYATDKLETGDFIGFIGFSHPGFEIETGLKPVSNPCIEIGWRIKSNEWNKGYATEGAIACLDYGFKTLNFDMVYSFTSVLNLKSEKIMTKIGMEKIGEFNHPGIENGHRLKRHVIYMIKNHQFMTKRLTGYE